MYTMTSDQQIILFDLASKDGNKCWSYNPWKTRLVLAHKQLAYTTEFLDYPDIKTRLAPHLPDATQDYTIPTIQYTDGRYIMDSKAIARALEQDHPEPPLHLDDSDSPYLAQLERHLEERLMPTLRPLFVPLVPQHLLREASLDYFRRTREQALGMTLNEFAAREGRDFSKAAPHLRTVSGWLREKDDGPYFMGATVSYVDFVWAGILLFARRADPSGQKLDALLEATGDAGVHRALLDALAPLAKRDDH